MQERDAQFLSRIGSAAPAAAACPPPNATASCACLRASHAAQLLDVKSAKSGAQMVATGQRSCELRPAIFRAESRRLPAVPQM